ncbi:MAG TPA: LPS assembly protein LptD [Candidatus Angelobacter sp.]|nr:LPS assembly protein LptD [Candidatus Angelobacter sp.]
MKRLLSIPLCFLLMAPLLSEAAEEKTGDPETIDIEAVKPGEIEYNYEKGVCVITNDFVIRYKGAVLSAQSARLDETNVVAEGAVHLQYDNQVWRGEHVQYNFFTREMSTGRFRTGKSPFFATGEGLAATPSKRVHNSTNAVDNATNAPGRSYGVDAKQMSYSATNAFVTTDDVETPGFRVCARRLTIVPGKYFVARDAVLYFGSVPVFYFPYYRRNFDRRQSSFDFTPGYRSAYGPYLLGAYNWYWNEKLYGSLHADYRSKRGFGGGPDAFYDAGELGSGTVRYYLLHDHLPGFMVLTNGYFVSSTNGLPIDRERYRLDFAHQVTIRTNLTAAVVLRQESDPFVARDFFETEYRDNTQPASFAEIHQHWSNFSLDVFAQPRVNDFFETIERLPDVKFTGERQQLGVSPFYYESESSVGWFRHTYANDWTNNFSATRADTFHQLLLPQTFFGWLNLTPRVGGRFTDYGEVDGFGQTNREQQRWVFNTGAEVSLKASRLWQGAQNGLFDVDGLRHIIQPSLNYVYVPTPNKAPPQLPQFDSELQTLRLLPVDFPDYNSIDSVDSENVLRIGLLNKLQTKRHDGVENLINWSLFTDWRIKPRPDQNTFADLYSDLDFKPRSWITFNSETRFDLNDRQWREANHTLTLSPNSVWSWSVGHRYLRSDPLLGPDSGNNTFLSSFYYRFNENWAGHVLHRFEARDGTLEEQYYTLYRDFRSWTAALTFRVRENRIGPTDYGVAATFSLKAIPRFKLGDDQNKPTMLLGD